MQVRARRDTRVAAESKAKNAALPILAASVMTDETVYIDNLPDVRDTNVLLKAMQGIGVLEKRTGRHSVTLNAAQISSLVVLIAYCSILFTSYRFI